ncbi:MAG: GAF domain-containing sensor histidine kinase [Dehalococcoidia bacterium]|nr:MAG: GAF domain-containing sensor histidine kinase [Dehalococcoidia bacterium]
MEITLPRQQKLASELRRLRWTTIVAPVAFIMLLEFAQRSTADSLWRSPLGFVVTLLLVTAGAGFFALSVFRQIARFEARAAKRSAQIEALNRLAAATSENLDLATTVGRGLDQIVAATGADASLVCRLFADEEEHTAIGSRGFSPAVMQRIQRAKLAEDVIASEVVRSGQPVRFGNVLSDPDVRAISTKEGIMSGVSVPLMCSGAVNGIVVVAYRREYRFDDDDYAFLHGVGQHLGLAIHNAELYDASVAQNRELSALLDVQAATSSSLDLDDVLARALSAVTKLTRADEGEIWLSSGDGLVLHCRADAVNEPLLDITHSPHGKGLLGRATVTGKTIRVVAGEPDFNDALTARGYRVCCAVPLCFRGSSVGVMVLAASEASSMSRRSELSLLDAIGDQIAPAVENANLHRKIQEVSIMQERERISREMHDGMGQILGYVNTQVLAVRKLLDSGNTVTALEELRHLDAAARSLYADVRDNILALRSAPGEQGFTAALAEYITSYREMFGIDAVLEVAPEVERVRRTPTCEIQLIRIVQQALSNVRQHAVATSVQTRLSVDCDTLVVEVSDDGAGFDPEALPATGRPRFGLQMMRERAQAAGGTFDIESHVGRGTRVVVRMPIER